MKGLDKKERRFTERPEGLPSAVVRGGQRIVGWFQVEGQGARLGRMRVCQVLSLAPKGRHEAVYWFGWFREERGRARLVAMNACRWVAIEDVVPARAKVPKGNWFVTADDDTFAFVEDVPPGDEACARELGARPVGEVVVEQRTWCASEGRVGRHDSAQESS